MAEGEWGKVLVDESPSHSAFIKVKNEFAHSGIVLYGRPMFIPTSQIKLLHQKSAGMTAEFQQFN